MCIVLQVDNIMIVIVFLSLRPVHTLSFLISFDSTCFMLSPGIRMLRARDISRSLIYDAIFKRRGFRFFLFDTDTV